MKRIIILGANGMLGQMVKFYFESKGYSIIVHDVRFNEQTIFNFVQELNNYDSGIVINCIGRIKQKSDLPYDLFLSNTLLPLEMSRSLDEKHLLIHPSTDCVFNGSKITPYNINDRHDANDIYGISKSLGERSIAGKKNSIIVRVSIVGLDNLSNKGLLGWFLSQPTGTTLKGFINHKWNGITTLEWCKQIENLLEKRISQKNGTKLIQLGTKKVYSKYDMLICFQKVFGTNYNILEFEDKLSINRSLKPNLISNDLEIQLTEMRDFISFLK
jgi:dTDP-4-dehydrorhamnose reductase